MENNNSTRASEVLAEEIKKREGSLDLATLIGLMATIPGLSAREIDKKFARCERCGREFKDPRDLVIHQGQVICRNKCISIDKVVKHSCR